MNGKANRLALGFALVLAAATFAVPRAAAQQLEGVGVRAGYGRTQLSFTVFDTDQADAFMGGVFLPFRIDQTISIRSELLYVQKGGRVETPPREDEPDASLRETQYDLSYLQLPVVLRFDVPLSERFDIYFGGGPYGALQLAESTETDIEETGQEPIDSESFERFDYGALGEAGVEVPFESYALQLSVRYGFGIADLLQEEVRRVEGDINNTINTRALFFTAGFRF